MSTLLPPTDREPPAPMGERIETAHLHFATSARIAGQMATADLLALARERALDPSIFDERQPFFMRAQISSSALDAYYTRMHTSTLRNFAEDAGNGVSVQDSHNARELGWGRSLTGVYTGPGGPKGERVESDLFTIPGYSINGRSSDDYILGVRSGLIADTSVGFYGGRFICSLCGLSIWDWSCPHIPGVEYTPLDSKGNEKDPVTAFSWIHDGRLAEYSAVYDGATPGAAFMKAQTEARAGRLSPRLITQLEAQYRMSLPAPLRGFAGVDLGAKEETETMAAAEDRTTPNPADEALSAIRAALARAGIADDGKPLAQAVTALVEENARLRPLADDGRDYRTALLAETLAEGVRAMGPTFAEETYKGLLANAPLDALRRQRDDWKAIGDRTFPGGRLTTDPAHEALPDQEPARSAQRRDHIPAHAYRA